LKSKKRHAVLHHKSYGPVFGVGYDIMVSDNALDNQSSYVEGNTYAASKYTLNGGTRHFQVEDYVVYKAIPL